ncbi:MFS transporter [Siccirubricoccus deserti]|uniref:MFS transporter n=1 Tax=Siccirubricoccus deserti TaxID=2013562 RepID=A0A9X0R2Z6_9PROT|nr:MFS transporter [Siccirubricoccus deserti]MBC4018665.1 MFS transporter [Siccirubricoccus deserti]
MASVAFTVSFVVFGTMYSFGAFFAPMAVEFGAGMAATSAFFSITGLVFYLAGAVAGRLGDRFGPAVMTAIGGAVMGGGLVLNSLAGQIWAGYLAYGVGVGLGAACAYTPTLAVLGGWFVRRRNAALGLAAAGTGCGMLVLPPLTAALIGQYGWRATSAMLGLGCAAVLALAATLVRRPPLPPAGEPHLPLGRIMRSPEFLALYASWVLATTALFVPLVLLPADAAARGASELAGAALLSLLGGSSVVGRLGMGALAERVGTARLFKASVLLMAASYLLWLAAASYAWLAAFAVTLGLGYGLRIALMPAVLIGLFGVRNLGALLGAFFTASGIAAALGPPLAGLVVDATGGHGWGIGFALAVGTLGFLAIVPLRLDRAGPAATVPRSD